MTNIEIIIELAKQLTIGEVIALRDALGRKQLDMQKIESEKFKELGIL